MRKVTHESDLVAFKKEYVIAAVSGFKFCWVEGKRDGK